MAEAEEQIKPARRMQLMEYKGSYVWDVSEMEELASMKIRDDDVWMCSYPRSGTTLTQQTIYLIMTLDFEKSRTVDLGDRFPLAECNDNTYPFFRGIKYLDDMPTSEPRMIKTHIHHYLLPEELKNGKGKMVYITRNPKASLVSLYRVMKYLDNPQAPSLREYVERFLTQKGVYTCPWGLHVREFWQRRNDPNILFLQFEKVVKDRRGTIRKLADFLGKVLTDEQVDKILEATSIESMRTNNAVNLLYMEKYVETVGRSDGVFINKGETTGWKQDLEEDLIQKMDELIKNELKDTDIVYE